MSRAEESPSVASQALLSAALGGLLCLSAACSTSSSGASANASGASSSTSTTTSSGDTPIPATECDGGVSPDPAVTSSTVVANLTLDAFTSQCNAVSGIVEIQPHCGGSNACRGMSYDSNTETLTQHTCRGTNSCAGFSCVVCN